MSGDVQPRKRKDKKKKKDELSLDEPRGTAAALGEGDVLMHSYHDHGTGGHWCAKIIFFSLLAVLITLIGLIILENRGLSELEAKAVESRYSGILEGWLEDAPDDDHHDAHTLELKHHDDDENDIGNEDEEENEDDHGDNEDEHDDDDEHEHGDDDDDEHDGHDNKGKHGAGDEEDENADQDEDEENDEQDSQQDLDDAFDEDEDDRRPYKYFDQDDDDDKEEDQDKQDEDEQDEIENDTEDNEDDNESNEFYNEDDSAGGDFEDEPEETPSNDDEESEDQEDEDEHDDEDEDEDDGDDDDELEVEKIEQEASEEDQEPISVELPALPEEEDADDGKDDEEDEANDSQGDDDTDDDVDETAGGDSQDDDDFLEVDDVPPIVERITAPAGKPYVEVEEDEDSTEKPPDTLEEEEEYEKQQEELRKEEEQSSHMWLKLSVGGALLLVTHAVMRRATAPRDEGEEERVAREATPVDRRMTLIPEEVTPPVIPKKVEEPKKPIVAETVKQAPVFRAPPPPVSKPESEDEEVEEPEEVEEEDDEKAELYSDEEVEEQIIIPQRAAPKHRDPPKPDPEPEPEPEPEDDVPDDVEIIDDEQIEEEEMSEEEEEEEISDVDDAELLSRLEAKYGRLPELERAGQRHSNLEDGGNSVDDDWPGEPADAFWRDQLDSAEQQLRQGAWSAAMERANSAELQRSARAKYIVAASLDRMAEAQRDNRLLSRAITAYLEVLKMSDSLTDKKLLDVAKRTLDRIQFRGMYLSAEPVYRLLIRRFPDEPGYRNNLTISFLMANRVDLAEGVLKETLTQWPDDRVALAHYGFVLKVNNNKLEEAVGMFEKALEGDKGPACEPRFYYHYGDALLLLGRFKEAQEVHKRGAKHGHFLSPAQRSLYNVPRLKGKPWWNVEETPYLRLAKSLEKSWRDILKEGEAAKALYEKEKEGLKERGEWTQMDLFVQGQEIPGRCKKAPVTCSIVKSEVAAAGCRRGQVKFSAMAAGTHVRPHVGPTNCRLRMHLGLSNTKHTYIRVDQEIRQWQEGKVLLFDDSFEHEVWHNGTGKRMVLIVDVWHPELTPQERRTLPAI